MAVKEEKTGTFSNMPVKHSRDKLTTSGGEERGERANRVTSRNIELLPSSVDMALKSTLAHLLEPFWANRIKVTTNC